MKRCLRGLHDLEAPGARVGTSGRGGCRACYYAVRLQYRLDERAPGGRCNACGRLFASDAAFDRHASRRTGCYADAELRARGFASSRRGAKGDTPAVWRLRSCRRCPLPVVPGLGFYCRRHYFARALERQNAANAAARAASDRPCARCGRQRPAGRPKYCADRCRYRDALGVRTLRLECKQCGDPLPARRSAYCSDRCAREGRLELRRAAAA